MNRSAKIKRWGGVFLAFAALLAVVLFSAPTFAAGISKDSLIEKAALTGLYRCYLSGNMRKTIDIDKYTGPSYLYTGDAQFKVAMPSGYTDRNLLTCTQILDGVRDRNKGANAYGGLATTAGALSTLTTPDAKARFLTGMGYQLESSSSEESQSCAIFTYDTTIDPADFRQDTVSSVNTTTVCLKTADGKIDSDRPTVTHSSSINNGQVTQDNRNSGLQFVAGKNKVTCQFAGDSNKTEVKFKVGDTWQSFYDGILTNGCAKDSTTYVSAGGGLVTQQRREPQNNPGGNAASTYEFPSDKKETAAESAIRTLSNSSYRNYAAVALNQEEKVILLQTYLEGFYQISNKGCELTGDSLSLAQGDGYKAARIFDKESNSFKSCYVKAEKNADSKVYVWDDTDHINRDNQMTFDEVLNALNGFTITALSDPSAIGDITSATEDPADVSSTTACFANAGPLGWIACPVLEAAGGLAETLYGFIETNFLQLDGSLITTDGLRSGWTQFRDFANILFAIAFVIVILAQVTGIGISNYNVKKILPRLIMVVVLVNVSFLLCQLAVDLSNIIGYSVRNLFDGFAQTAANAVEVDGVRGVPFNFMDVFSGVIGAASSTAAIAGIVAVFAIKIPWELWLFPIILAVIGCLISIFFFLLLLGVRQAGVIVLVALAPVAIVCYALPNTKPIFDKWRKIFVGLLLVYPICGLLMGGGQFASTLLLLVGHEGDVGAFFTIVAMLLSVVPFFLIPSILRNSMSAVGNLGAKVTQFGKNLGGGITRGIRGSEWGRNFQRQRQMSYDLKASQKLQKKRERKLANG